MLQRINTDVSAVVVALGATAFLADFGLTGLSHNEERWLRVKGILKLAIALIIVGAVIGSAGVLANLVFPQSLDVVLLVLTGAFFFVLGIIVEAASFVRARNKPVGDAQASSVS